MKSPYLCLLSACLLAAPAAEPLRLQQAVVFGTADADEWTGAAALPGGGLALVGNTWAERLPEPVLKIGTGTYRGLPIVQGTLPRYLQAERDKKQPHTSPGPRQLSVDRRALPIDYDNPDRSGIIGIFDATGTRQQMYRFAAGTLSLDAVASLPDGDLLIAGRSQDHLIKALGKQAPERTHRSEPPDFQAPELAGDRFAGIHSAEARRQEGERWRAIVRSHFGKRYYEGNATPGDAFIARFRPRDGHLQWLHIFAGHRSCERLLVYQVDGSQRVAVQTPIVYHLDCKDGRTLETGPLLHRVDAFDPRSGGSFRFGLGISGTHRKHNPLAALAADDRQGDELWAAYCWQELLSMHPELAAPASYATSCVAVSGKDELVVALQSDSRDSLAALHPFDLTRQPQHSADLVPPKPPRRGEKEKAPKPQTIVHLVRLQPEAAGCTQHALWHAERNGDLSLQRLVMLPDGGFVGIGLAVGSLPWLPEGDTYKLERDGIHPYVVVFDRTLQHLRLCRPLPASEITDLVVLNDGRIVVCGRAKLASPELDLPALEVIAPAVLLASPQTAHAGGYYDAYHAIFAP